jgi:pimeloyl-ACP methyl ester carboxylesterase
MNALTPNPGAELAERGAEALSRLATQAQNLMTMASAQALSFGARLPALPAPAVEPRAPLALAQDWFAYVVDASQRAILFWDVMRQAGNAFVAHEAAGCPPVLVFDFETLLDGRTLPRPVNYALVRILPAPGMPETDPKLRPFVIVDPRAGHGAGIGGFKSDSQVGVALRRGHPVYFVIFYREPEPGQTILDVTAAEGEFLRLVRARHQEAPKPVVIGNCQGGWAVMMVGAAEPDLTGPLVLNGAPLSYWAGEKGKNPMRYTGGLAGGAWPAALLADLGNGRFDGANLVLNFESLSPGNTWFRKYWNVYEKADTEAERFLEFERWWGGFFLMNAEEINWIVQNLFIGDRFAKGGLSGAAEGGLDMRAVRSPVIVFASAGDNITPPGQALRWIADVYRDEQEIRTLGQTIVYLLHEDVGHLGIFVSGKVAKKEHSEIATTLEMIEAVAPGLYEMVITDRPAGDPEGPYQVELVERRMADIRALAGEASNEAFPAVAKVSEVTEGIYELAVRPVVRALTTEASAELRRNLHPLRLRRSLVSDRNPMMGLVAAAAEVVRRHRAPAAADNAFIQMERRFADAVESAIGRAREAQDAMAELAFHAVYGGLAALGIAADAPARPAPVLAREAEALAQAARRAEAEAAQGGYAEAVTRMMILLAEARGGVRRSRLERSNRLLTTEEPVRSMTAAERQEMIRAQTLIASLQPALALETLPQLLPTHEDRRRALAAVESVAGPEAELGEHARAMLARQRAVLGLAAATEGETTQGDATAGEATQGGASQGEAA